MFASLKLFPMETLTVMKNMAYTCQLVFHYLVVTLVLFMWFNFQLSDAVHGKFVSLEEELHTFKKAKMHHNLSFSHYYEYILDYINW
jgi:hypothetical protein